MTTKEEYEKAIENIREAFYATTCPEWALEKFATNLDFISISIKEHFEEKQETNFEHYKDEIRNANFDFALKDGKVVPCNILSCKECRFYGNEQVCDVLELKWLYEQYKEKYKLTKFEYDIIKTFDHCKECCLLNEIECLKKLSEKGYFKGIDPFTKIHDIIDNCEVAKDER